jgi:uridine kinase
MTWVDPDVLHSGATVSQAAGAHVRTGAEQLASAPSPMKIFGDFTDAHVFHSQVRTHRVMHADVMRQHDRVLNDIGTKAHAAADGFVEVDQQNADRIRSVRPQAL